MATATLALCIAVSLSPAVRKFLRVDSSRVVLAHVEILDGTGAPPIHDRNLEVRDGKIAAIRAGADEPGALDLRGYTVIPGIVGMHEHLFYLSFPQQQPDGNYERPAMFQQMSFSAPRLYLANGVTTARTAGSIEPETDLRIKASIEAWLMPGPHLDVTGPYLEGQSDFFFLQMHKLTGPEDARRTVAFWAERGVSSFKAYQHLTRDEIAAAIDEAHQRGLKVTGHLCSITYPEAVERGIDNLEHGFFTNTQFDPDKKPDACSDSRGDFSHEHMTDAQFKSLVALLIRKHVALTSTLAGAAASVPGQTVRPAALEAMSPRLRESVLLGLNRAPKPDDGSLRKEMELERAFVDAGGFLMAGADPVGFKGLLPGFADQREIELLVEAGFSAPQAIRVATLNGAIYLGRDKQIGSVEVGKNADLVVVKGDPASRIADIENVEIVFQDGFAYDSRKLLESVRGSYGDY